jgi:acyl-CoA thioester hydrolase
MALGSFPVKLQHRVAWGEMDAFGHVNNANYLRWFESARIAYFERIAVSISAKDSSTWVPILGRATIDFRKPVAYPDTVTLEATVTKLGNTSFSMAYRAVSEKLGLAAEGEAIVVLLDRAGQKVPLPDDLRKAVESLEAQRPLPASAG